MTQLAVRSYVATLLADLDLPVPAQVFVQEPKQTSIGSNTVIVIKSPHSKENRQRGTMPLGSGQKHVTHEVFLSIVWEAADEQVGGDEFDVLLSKIDAALRPAFGDLPVNLNDPQTGEPSRVIDLGEEIDTTRLEPVVDDGAQGLVVFAAAKTLTVLEVIQG